MANKKRTYEAESLQSQSLQIRGKSGREQSRGSGRASSEKVRLPESRDLVVRLIEKIKQQ